MLDCFSASVLKDGEKWLLDAGLLFFPASLLKDGEKWLVGSGAGYDVSHHGIDEKRSCLDPYTR